MFLGLEKEIKGVADKGLEPANPGLGSLPCSWISEIEWGLGVGGGHWRLSHDHWEGSNDNSLLRTWPHPVSRLVPPPIAPHLPRGIRRCGWDGPAQGHILGWNVSAGASELSAVLFPLSVS